MVRPRRVAGALGAAALLALVAGSVYAGPKPPPPSTFRISGSVDGLYPGGTRTMALKLTSQSQPLLVTRVEVSSVGVNKPHCGAGNVSSSGWQGQIQVPRNGTATISVPVRMSAGAPNACQGATFTLVYTGIGWR